MPVDRRLRWLTVGQASELLGVSPKTIRRWADAGRIPVTTTAGGHRRFLRTGLDQMAQPRDRHAERDEAVMRLLAEATRSDRQALGESDPTLQATFGETERAALRQRGRLLLATFLRQLETTGRLSARVFDAACRLGRDYARHLARRGLPASAALDTLAGFEGTFVEEVARMLRAGAPTRRDPLEVMLEVQRASTAVLRAFLDAYSDEVATMAPVASMIPPADPLGTALRFWPRSVDSDDAR